MAGSMKHSWRAKATGNKKNCVAESADLYQKQETAALLKILALGVRQISEGKTVRASDVVHRLRRSR